MREIHHVVDIDAEPVRVWWALTEHEGLTGWWSTELDTSPAAPGVQQRWTFAGDFNPIIEITELIDQQRVSWRCLRGHDNWNDNEFSFELHTLDDGRTRLRFWQHYAVELDDDSYGVYNFNWGYYLESLRLLVTSGAGKPFVPTGS